jgi:hypothetical protein
MSRTLFRIAGAIVGASLALAACSSSSKKSTTTTTSAAPSSSIASTSSSASIVTDTFPTTTVGPIIENGQPEDIAKAFFAAWQANNVTAMHNNGTPSAVTAAQAGRAGGTSGFVFSNCQGAAGSTFCTWVKRGTSIVIQATNVQTPHLVTGFQRNTLSAEDTANQFFDGYRENNASVVAALADAPTATKTIGLESHRNLLWVFQDCSGAAGSLFCTFTAGSSKLVIRVVQVNPPPQVGDITFTP